MNADYLALIQHSLNTHISVTVWKNQESAIHALKAGEVDMVLTGLESRPFTEEGILSSQPLVHSWPNFSDVVSQCHGSLAECAKHPGRYCESLS
ncbi:Sensor protein evgS precursor [Citrobacter koseri]|uniref:Sensor protein evgS n=1 Tax=Citrobacter koseri TaxID=545 RepID=A0A447UKL5_CITKO|nr:Sensor protein evgS precursor [Citrobacter koseri]